MGRARKKPVEIDYEQFIGTAESAAIIIDWVTESNGTAEYHKHLMDGDLIAHPDPYLKIVTLEGTMIGSVGDYIIKGVQGEFYPCKPDIFEATYDKVQ